MPDQARRSRATYPLHRGEDGHAGEGHPASRQQVGDAPAEQQAGRRREQQVGGDEPLQVGGAASRRWPGFRTARYSTFRTDCAWGTARGSGSPSAALVVEVAVCGRVEDEVRLVLVAGRVSSRRRTGATGIRSKGPIRRRLWSRRCAGAVTSSVSGRWVGRTELFDFGALGSASAKQARTWGGCRDCDGRGRAPSRSRISVARLLLARPTAPTYRTVGQRPRAAAHVQGYRPGGPFRTYSGRPPRGSLVCEAVHGSAENGLRACVRDPRRLWVSGVRGRAGG